MDNNYTDAFREQRMQLVNQLRRKGIEDEKVLSAISKVPREIFVEGSFKNRAYEDTALPISEEQTISQPYTVAYMTASLNIHEKEKVFEIGTGSGYQGAIIALMGAKLFTVERIQPLYEKARKMFRKLDLHVNLKLGDGSLGWKKYAPYDKIIVTAASPKVPDPLLNQLAVGGRMVIPIGDKRFQTMHIIEKTAEGEYKDYRTDSFKFVPLVGREGWNE